MAEDRRTLKRYSPVITLGNILTIIIIAGGVGGWMLTDHDTIVSVRAEHVSLAKEIVTRDARDREFRDEMRESLAAIRSDIRQMREGGEHVRWRDLPPSSFRKSR